MKTSESVPTVRIIVSRSYRGVKLQFAKRPATNNQTSNKRKAEACKLESGRGRGRDSHEMRTNNGRQPHVHRL